MATLVQLMQKFDTKRFFALDDYYDSDRMAYYAALKSVDPKTINITKWLEYFCEGVAFSVNRVKEKVLVLSGSKKATASLEQIALTKRQMQIVEVMSKSGKITSKEMQTMFRITPQAIHKEMKKLLGMKVVKLIGKGRGARYEIGIIGATTAPQSSLSSSHAADCTPASTERGAHLPLPA